MKPTRRTATAIALLALATTGSGAEKKISRADLPPAVEKTVAAESKGATIRGFSSEVEGGELRYEVAMTVAGRGRDVSIAPDGRVLEIEEEIAWDALPAAVRQGLEKAAGGAKIAKVESLTREGKVVGYEAQVVAGSKRSEVQVGPDGKPADRQ